MKSRLFLFIVLSLLLSACAQQTQTPVITDNAQYQQRLSQLHAWQADGKIAIQQPNQSNSAAVHWTQDKTHFDIFLSGPLGIGSARIIGTPESLTLIDSKGEYSTTSNVQELITRRLGWTFPIAQLPQWVLGATDALHAEFNTDHTLANFAQDGWHVEYQTYQIVDQWLLPEKMVLTHEDLRITLVIKHWTIP